MTKISDCKEVENIAGKGNNADCYHFLLLPQYFQTLYSLLRCRKSCKSCDTRQVCFVVWKAGLFWQKLSYNLGKTPLAQRK